MEDTLEYWQEVLDQHKKHLEILDNICFADYIDRITFQNQIWQFNEMSSLIKTFYNNKIFHNSLNTKPALIKSEDIRFTKVLTKYSTEYNNQLFIFNMTKTLLFKIRFRLCIHNTSKITDFVTVYLLKSRSDYAPACAVRAATCCFNKVNSSLSLSSLSNASNCACVLC